MFFRTCLSLFLFCFAINSYATEAPSVRCISISAINGDITLTWQPPSDPLSEFFSYHVYSATTQNGPYSDIITFSNISTNSFTHIGAGGNLTDRFYFIKTFYGPGGSSQSSASDTLHAIVLKTTKPFNNNAVAGLSWNPIHSPILPSSGKYKIYKEYPAGNWFLLDSTINTAYADTNNKVCDETFINYRIEIADSYGCISVSTIARDKFKDEQPPLKTNIIRVSVDPSGKANISWQANPAKDLKGYVIFKKNSFNQFTPIASNVPNTATDYTDLASSPDVKPEIYSISAFDSCATANNGVFDTSGQSTIHLAAFIDLCDRSINLSWNQYVNWEQDVKEYQLFRSENGAPFTLLSTLTASTITYKDQALSAYSTYSYYIMAVENGSAGITSNSNITPILNNTVAPPPSYLEIISASVDFSSQKVQILYNVDNTVKIKNIKVLRSTDNINFTQTDLLPEPSNSENTYLDVTSEPNSQRYFYKLTATDSCDRDVKISEPAGTMFLQATANIDLNVDLSWNDYFGWDGDLYLYRSVDEIWENNPFSTFNFSVNSYKNDITPYLKSLGKFCYYLKARKFSDPGIESNSNISCAVEEPKLYAPNAFTPNDDGLNDVFLPVNIFVDPDNYSMIIYDRWGNYIFESKHPETGWDGRVNGKGIAISGIYAYQIRFTATNGLKFEKTGSISLIR